MNDAIPPVTGGIKPYIAPSVQSKDQQGSNRKKDLVLYLEYKPIRPGKNDDEHDSDEQDIHAVVESTRDPVSSRMGNVSYKGFEPVIQRCEYDGKDQIL